MLGYLKFRSGDISSLVFMNPASLLRDGQISVEELRDEVAKEKAQFQHIDKETITDLKLYAWTGTISLFIGFICASVLMYLLFNSPAVVF